MLDSGQNVSIHMRVELWLQKFTAEGVAVPDASGFLTKLPGSRPSIMLAPDCCFMKCYHLAEEEEKLRCAEGPKPTTMRQQKR